MLAIDLNLKSAFEWEDLQKDSVVVDVGGVKGPSVFLLKAVLHDWSDSYCEKILQQLRDAAQPHTKLIVIDSIVPYACRVPTDDEDRSVPGSTPKEAPEPLLAKYGVSNGMAYIFDLTASVSAGLLYRASGLISTRLTDDDIVQLSGSNVQASLYPSEAHRLEVDSCSTSGGRCKQLHADYRRRPFVVSTNSMSRR